VLTCAPQHVQLNVLCKLLLQGNNAADAGIQVLQLLYACCLPASTVSSQLSAFQDAKLQLQRNSTKPCHRF
jgi:hypothetical protein